MIDKLILTGGQNVHPQFYGEKKTIESDDYNLVRDEFELALLKEALRQNKTNYGKSVAVFNLSMLPLGELSIKKSKATGKAYLSEHLTLLRQ